MMHSTHRFLVVLLALGGLSANACGKDGPGLPGSDGGLPGLPGVTDNPVAKAAANACGLDIDCKGGGIAEGNASISGVASIDAFFQSVLNFQAKAGNLSAGIDAQLGAIRADFGIAAGADLKAGLQEQIAANVEGKLNVQAEPARCHADVSATLEAQAHCEGMVDPGSVMVACEGSCDVEASAMVKCDAMADLKCTVTAPSVACTGECQGSCDVKLTAAVACDGTCTGSCDGTCSAYSDSGKTMCAGKCSGMCGGSCKTELAAGASCKGTCEGECTVTNPAAGCEGGIKATCEAKAGAKVMCEGRCEGNVEPPSASVECDASVKAEAKMNVECTPPRLSIDYQLKAGASVDVKAQAKFVAAVENLKVRLPALLASIKNASLVAEAGADLTTEASGALKAGINTASKAALAGDLKVVFGLQCAVGQVGKVGGAIAGAANGLKASLTGAASVTGAVGL